MWDDDDFCARARKLGVPSRVIADTWVTHERHATFQALGLDVTAAMREGWRRYGDSHAPVRVAAMAKDEANAIEGYFDQFRGLTTDRSLLDTGSTDDTIDLARRAGARVAHFADVETAGFAAARNAAVTLACEGRENGWVIMIDPDERLDAETIRAIPELIASAGDRFDVFLAPLVAVQPDGSRRSFVAKPFLWRPTAGHWRYLVHEKLVGGRHALLTTACIEHRLALHTPARREEAAWLYDRLARREPYFTDDAFRALERERAPILDHDRHDDPRIQKIAAGPLVSVVIPTFNRPDLCIRAVRSALNQDWVTLEVVVVGDACPRFDLVAQAFRDQPRVRCLNLPRNHGAGGAVPRNVGIHAAAGTWIAYLDDDCAWDADHVSSVMAAIRQAGASWGFSSMRVFNGTDLGFRTPARGQIDTSCVVHERRLFDEVGAWRSLEETRDYAHDWEFFSRLVTNGEPWAATGRPTLDYNAETSSQRAFLERLVARQR